MVVKEFFKVSVIGVAFLLVACASTPASDVAAIEASLAAADTAALAYVQLPKCGGAIASAACSSPVIVKNIGIASQAAYTAVKAAEASKDQTSIVKAQGAVSALQSIVATVTAGM